MSEALLELHSDVLRVLIAPRIGARIVSICDRDGNEYVEAGRHPADPLTPEHSYLDGGLGGIDDCFPGITAETLTSPARSVRSSPSSTVLPKKLFVIPVATRTFSAGLFEGLIGGTATLWHASLAFVEHRPKVLHLACKVVHVLDSARAHR